MEQQRLSSEIGIQMHVCKSNNPNDKFTANDMTCSMPGGGGTQWKGGYGDVRPR